jgi:FdhE protein
MKWAWDRRIARAEDLAKTCAPAAELLALYARLATFQRSIYEELAANRRTDPACVAPYYSGLRAVAGPIADLSDVAFEPLLHAHWNHEPDPNDRARFVARALLQPFAEALAARATPSPNSASGLCLFCGARPFVSVLREEGAGGKRHLVCSLCSGEWEFRRILCPYCGEERKDKLPIYSAPEFDHIRIEACDRCHTYLKSIDLTRNGLAVPHADELAGVALNVWAEEHGYSKIEANLLGL